MIYLLLSIPGYSIPKYFSSPSVEGKKARVKNHFISLNFSYFPNERVGPNDLEVLFGLNEATYCGWLSPIMGGGEGQAGTQGGSLQPLLCGVIRTLPLRKARKD